MIILQWCKRKSRFSRIRTVIWLYLTEIEKVKKSNWPMRWHPKTATDSDLTEY